MSKTNKKKTPATISIRFGEMLVQLLDAEVTRLQGYSGFNFFNINRNSLVRLAVRHWLNRPPCSVAEVLGYVDVPQDLTLLYNICFVCGVQVNQKDKGEFHRKYPELRQDIYLHAECCDKFFRAYGQNGTYTPHGQISPRK